jgi:NAD(P)-dependent dehydrogenase (short-subunit alcohol dehydrogenase family)
MGLLDGKVVMITGASSGIGRATAVLSAREGANVVLCARRSAEGEETARLVREAGGEAVFQQADVADEAAVRGLVELALSTFGRVDCAFNNAGIGSAEEGKNRLLTADYETESFQRVMDINLMGTWYCMKYQIPQMLKQGSGAIVNVSSVLGLRGAPTSAPYAASKHAVLGMTKCAAMEYAAQGIRINAICPGFVKTPMTDLFTEQRAAGVLAATPMKRPAEPEELAEHAVWLMSDRASFMTGTSIVVDGGLTV